MDSWWAGPASVAADAEEEPPCGADRPEEAASVEGAFFTLPAAAAAADFLSAALLASIAVNAFAFAVLNTRASAAANALLALAAAISASFSALIRLTQICIARAGHSVLVGLGSGPGWNVGLSGSLRRKAQTLMLNTLTRSKIRLTRAQGSDVRAFVWA